MASKQNISIDLIRVSFDPWEDKCTQHLPEGTFLFYISIVPFQLGSEPIDINSIQCSFIDSSDTSWEYIRTETLEADSPWEGVASFHLSNPKDSPDILIEHSELCVIIEGHGAKVEARFDIFHKGPMGDLTSEKVAL